MKTILFDLDGTLLPMDQDVFTKAYLKRLAAFLAPHGYQPQLFTESMWSGIAAMLGNDGKETNERVFWRAFSAKLGRDAYADIALFDEFYATEFDKLKDSCGFDAAASEAIKKLKAMGHKLVLATNPVFPLEAYKVRLGWAGVDPDSIEFITTYENSHYCKPRGGYYREIADRLGVKPCECIMVGNDVGDDMPAKDVGMDVFLMTENLINTENADISVYAQGGFDALLDYISDN